MWYLSSFRKFVEKVRVSLNSDKKKWHFTWRRTYIYVHIHIHTYIYIYIYIIISRSVFHKMRKVSGKYLEKIKTNFLLNNFFFFKNRAVYEIIWKNIVQPSRPQMTIWRMRIECWITKATNTFWKYVIFIALPPRQLMGERASVLYCYTVTLLYSYTVILLHCYTVTLLYCYRVTQLHCYTVIQLHCYTVIELHCYTVTLLYSYTVILLYSYTVILLHCYTVTLLYCYTVIQLHCYTVTLLYSYTVTLLYTYTVILLYSYTLSQLYSYTVILLYCYIVHCLSRKYRGTSFSIPCFYHSLSCIMSHLVTAFSISPSSSSSWLPRFWFQALKQLTIARRRISLIYSQSPYVLQLQKCNLIF